MTVTEKLKRINKTKSNLEHEQHTNTAIDHSSAQCTLHNTQYTLFPCPIPHTTAHGNKERELPSSPPKLYVVEIQAR